MSGSDDEGERVPAVRDASVAGPAYPCQYLQHPKILHEAVRQERVQLEDVDLLPKARVA
jgi:hypothetical protein